VVIGQVGGLGDPVRKLHGRGEVRRLVRLAEGAVEHLPAASQ
jgi:hypothetical protein